MRCDIAIVAGNDFYADAAIRNVDAHAVHRERRRRTRQRLHRDRHRPAIRRELYGVRQQVEQNLLQPPFVQTHHRNGRIDRRGDADARFGREPFHDALDRGDGVAQVELVRAQLHLAGFDLR